MFWMFTIALVIDGIGTLAALYFIVSDSLKYSSGTHTGPLPLIMLVVCCWIAATFYLYHHGHPLIGTIMACIPALPLAVYGLFVLLFMIVKPNMR